jgi:hypothetical protein
MYSEEYKNKAEKLGQKINELSAQYTLKVVELEDARQAIKTLESRVATMERENKSLRMFGGGYNTSKSMMCQECKIKLKQTENQKKLKRIMEALIKILFEK